MARRLVLWRVEKYTAAGGDAAALGIGWERGHLSYQGFYFRPAKGEQVRVTVHPAPEARGAVCARVVDGAGAPAEDVLAMLFRVEEAGEYRLLGAACTDSAGYFAFGPLEADALYYIKFGGGSLRMREIELES